VERGARAARVTHIVFPLRSNAPPDSDAIPKAAALHQLSETPSTLRSWRSRLLVPWADLLTGLIADRSSTDTCQMHRSIPTR